MNVHAVSMLVCYMYNRATVRDLCLVVLLITFLMFYCVLLIDLSELNVCMYVCMYVECVMTVHGHPRSLISVTMKNVMYSNFDLTLH